MTLKQKSQNKKHFKINLKYMNTLVYNIQYIVLVYYILFDYIFFLKR